MSNTYMIVTRKMSFIKQNLCVFGRFITKLFSKKDNSSVSHADFVLGNIVFEYSTKGWEKSTYNPKEWEEVHLKGKTDWTPDRLEKAINENGGWVASDIPDKLWEAIQSPYLDLDETQGLIQMYETYKLQTHNCHGFARFCLNLIKPGCYFQNWKGPLLDFTQYE